MKIFLLRAALPALFLLTACKKDDDEIQAPTKTSFLTEGSWKLTAIVSDEDGNGSYETDVFSSLPACFTDNFVVFKPNFQVEINEGPTKCDPSDPQVESRTWSLTDNESNLVVDGDVYAVQELSKTTLKWREDGPANTSSILTMTKR